MLVKGNEESKCKSPPLSYQIKPNESSRHTACLKQSCIPRKKPDGTIKSSCYEQKTMAEEE